jgi:hypothetical protein
VSHIYVQVGMAVYYNVAHYKTAVTYASKVSCIPKIVDVK